MCILERESILEQNGQGSLALLSNVYTRERKHFGTKWSRVTCLTLPLTAAQSLGSQVLEDSQSHWRLTIAIENKQLQANK
jgi:hypothetical protein